MAVVLCRGSILGSALLRSALAEVSSWHRGVLELGRDVSIRSQVCEVNASVPMHRGLFLAGAKLVSEISAQRA